MRTLLACGVAIHSHKIHHFSLGDKTKGKTYPLDGLETIPDGEGHQLEGVRNGVVLIMPLPHDRDCWGCLAYSVHWLVLLNPVLVTHHLCC